LKPSSSSTPSSICPERNSRIGVRLFRCAGSPAFAKPPHRHVGIRPHGLAHQAIYDSNKISVSCLLSERGHRQHAGWPFRVRWLPTMQRPRRQGPSLAQFLGGQPWMLMSPSRAIPRRESPHLSSSDAQRWDRLYASSLGLGRHRVAGRCGMPLQPKPLDGNRAWCARQRCGLRFLFQDTCE